MTSNYPSLPQALYCSFNQMHWPRIELTRQGTVYDYGNALPEQARLAKEQLKTMTTKRERGVCECARKHYGRLMNACLRSWLREKHLRNTGVTATTKRKGNVVTYLVWWDKPNLGNVGSRVRRNNSPRWLNSWSPGTQSKSVMESLEQHVHPIQLTRNTVVETWSGKLHHGCRLTDGVLVDHHF